MDRPELLPSGLQTGLLRLQVGLLGLQAGLNLAPAVFPQVRNNPWIAIFPLAPTGPWKLPALVLGLGLLGLMLGLARRKRYAWTAALAMYAWAGAWWMAGGSVVSATAAFALAALLWLQRSDFTARSDPAAVRKGFLIWGGLWLAVVAIIAANRLTLVPEPLSLEDRVAQASWLFWLFPATNSARYDWLAPRPEMAISLPFVYVLSIAAWLILWWSCERPMPAPGNATNEERSRALEIVRAYGRTSMAHLTLLPDKCYFFTPGGSVIAYAVCGRAALALGDPVGPDDDAPQAVAAFHRFCTGNDWTPAFCLTSSDRLQIYRREGFGALCLGHEGIINLKSFSLRGNASKTFRKRYNRLNSMGYRVQVLEPPIADEVLRELRRISDEWLGMARAAEKRFFLAWFDENYMRCQRLAIVHAPDASIAAFTSLVPEYQLNEISIDLMRRLRGIESGVMDFLFVSLFLWARQQGYDTFNIGLSPLFGVGDRPGGSLPERFIHFAYQRGNFYDFKGLNGFKVKFRPRWIAQYLIYPGLLSLPQVGLAMARANAGDNESLWQYFSSRPQQFPQDEPAETYLGVSD